MSVKITQLPAIAVATVDPANDVMEISDVSLSTSNKITVANLFAAMSAGGAPDGTNSAPSYTFSSEPNTGWYKEATARVGLAISGTQTLSLRSGTGTIVMGSSGGLNWTAGAPNATADTSIKRSGAGAVTVTDNTGTAGTGAFSAAAISGTTGSFSGSVTSTNSLIAGGGSAVGWTGRALFSSPDATNIYVRNNANNAYAALTLAQIIDGNKVISSTNGAQTINATNFRFPFAAAATSAVITNTLATANSIVQGTVATADINMKSVVCVAAAGSITVTANTAPNAQTFVNITLIN